MEKSEYQVVQDKVVDFFTNPKSPLFTSELDQKLLSWPGVSNYRPGSVAEFFKYVVPAAVPGSLYLSEELKLSEEKKLYSLKGIADKFKSHALGQRIIRGFEDTYSSLFLIIGAGAVYEGVVDQSFAPQVVGNFLFWGGVAVRSGIYKHIKDQEEQVESELEQLTVELNSSL